MTTPVLEAGPIHPSFGEVMSWIGFAPILVGSLLLAIVLYVRGYRILRRRRNRRFGPGHLAAFLAGMGSIWIALQSPLDELADRLLQFHMTQHLVLWFAAPLLVWIGEPFVPMLLGLPRGPRNRIVLPVLRARPVRALFRRITHPAAAFGIYVANLWLWHIPAFFDYALEHELVHEYAEHASFLTTGLLFWWPVVEPYPARPAWNRWLLVPMLFFAGLQGTALSGILTFSNRVLYSFYDTTPLLFGIAPLADQARSGVVMWIPGSLVYGTALVWVGGRLLYGRTDATGRAVRPKS